jgi:tetrahydromethanopterin S-methyltransferase subunit H
MALMEASVETFRCKTVDYADSVSIKKKMIYTAVSTSRSRRWYELVMKSNDVGS